MIRLRPLTASDVETIDAAMNDPDRAGAYSWFGYDPGRLSGRFARAENTAERRALERAGFAHEGTLRQAVFRDGQWRDSTIYSILRSDLDGESGSGG